MRALGLIALGAMLGALAVAGGTRASDATGAPKITSLLKTSLAEEFTPGREVLVDLVEIPPHTTLEKHWHPGEEFHYYLEGDVEIRIDGQETIVGTPGTVGHVPYGAKHTAVTGDKAAKALVFRVHTTGEPVRHLVGEEAAPEK